MPYKLLMSWIPRRKGWYKKYRGDLYSVSARQLDSEPTKQGSWRAANRWWEAKKAEIDAQACTGPGDDPHAGYRSAVALLAAVQEYEQTGAMPDRVAVDLGDGKVEYSFEGVQQEGEANARRAIGALNAALKKPDSDRTVGGRAEAWYRSLRSSVDAGRISVSRWGAYQRNLDIFKAWVGLNDPIDSLTAARLEEYYAHLSGLVASGRYAPAYARSLFAATQQFIAWNSELGLIALPGNLRSRKFRFGKSRPQGLSRADLFTPHELRTLLAAAGGRCSRSRPGIAVCE